MDSALAFGADGVVPGIGNVDPAGYVRIFDAIKRGDFAAALTEQDRLFQMFDLIFVGAHRMSVASSALGAFKASLKLLGIIDDALMAPRRLFRSTRRTRDQTELLIFITPRIVADTPLGR